MNDQVLDIANQYGLAWTAERKALISSDGLATNSYGIFHSKTKKHLGTHGSEYVPYQNYELISHFLQACNEVGITKISGGCFKEGKKVYLQAHLEETSVGNDTIKRYITGINSFDGTSSVSFGPTNVTISCSNTFMQVVRDKGMTRFKHTPNSMSKLSGFVKDLNAQILKEKELVLNLQKLADKKLKEEWVDKVIEGIFEVDLSKDLSKEYSTRKINQIKEFKDILQPHGLEKHGNTAWGLFSAVTYYNNYVSAKEENRLEYNFLGTGAVRNNKALEILECV